jgi:hypothetical protein
MRILSEIARGIRGRECEMLVKKTQNEITISGVNIGMSDFKIDIANFSNKLIELVKATQVAIALDDSQYLLCKALSTIRDDDQLKNYCQRLRLMLLMAFSQLRAILGSLDERPSDDLKAELVNWIKYMNDLNIQSIKLLEPGPKMPSKGPQIARIMRYQGIDENQIQEAISLM